MWYRNECLPYHVVLHPRGFAFFNITRYIYMRRILKKEWQQEIEHTMFTKELFT